MSRAKSKRQPQSSDSAAPVARFLCRIAEELQVAAISLDAIATPVDEAISLGSGLRHPPLLNALQELDRTNQILVSLAEFLVRLACAMPSTWIVDAGRASESILLSELADRLRSAGEAKGRELEPSRGQCEIF